MSEWGNIQGRKGKKNKKKQSNSMSEPIDLEAGKRIDEPEAANIAKAVYNIPEVIVSPPDEDTTNDDFLVVEAPKSDVVTEQSATATDAGVLKTMKAFTQHPPKTKTKAKLAEEKDTAKTTQRDSGTEVTEVVVPRPSITTPKEDSTKQPSTKDTVDTSETVVTEVAKTKATSKAAQKKTVRIQEPPVESNQADAAQQPKLAIVKSEAKAKLSLNPAVSAWSFAPESPRINTARSNTLTAGHKGTVATSRNDLEVLKSRIERSLGPKNVAPYPSVSMREDFNMGYKSMPPKTDRASSSHGLPSLDPFDHTAFSRFNNVRRPTVNDHGNILNVQTEEGKMTHVHERVLCQTSKYFQDLCGPALRRNRGDSNTLAWGPQSNFDGITSTYVHWLYNSNFPTAVIDVSDRTKVGEVLLYLAEEYVFGTQIQDREYRNAIMDAFITIHVRATKLTFRSVVHVVYGSTDPGSPLRQLLADMHAFIVISDLSKLDMMGRMPKAFVQDVLQSVAVIRPNEVDEWWWYLEKTGKMYHV